MIRDKLHDLNAQRGVLPGAPTPFTEFFHRAAAACAVGIAMVLLAWGAFYAIDVLLILFASVLVGILLRTISSGIAWLTGLSVRWSLVIVVMLLLVGTVLGLWMLAPEITQQVNELAETLPKSLDALRQKLEHYQWGSWLLNSLPSPESLLQERSVSRLTGIVWQTLGIAGTVFLALATGIYLAAQPELYVEGIVKLVAIKHRSRARQILDAVGQKLRWWMLAQLITMCVVGVLTGTGLWILGIQMAVVLGAFAGLVNFVPYFGPIIATIPAVLVALLDSTGAAMSVIGLQFGVQMLEGNVITPLIQQKTVSVPPVMTITMQLLLGVFVGAIGVALATPLTAACLVLVQMLYVQDVLGDTPAEEE